MSCEKLWDAKVARDVKGLVVGYETTMTSSMANAPAEAPASMVNRIGTEEVVLESTSEKIVIRKTTTVTNMGMSSNPRTEEKTELGATWIANCKVIAGNGGQLPSDIGANVKYEGDALAKRDEIITVRAGTFETHNVKNKSRMSW
jgi:hypothetical protein